MYDFYSFVVSVSKLARKGRGRLVELRNPVTTTEYLNNFFLRVAFNYYRTVPVISKRRAKTQYGKIITVIKQVRLIYDSTK